VKPRKVSRLWQDSWFSSLSAEVKVLYLFLLSSPEVRMGVHRMVKTYATALAGLTEKKLADGLAELVRAGVAAYDPETDEVLFLPWLEHYATASPRFRSGAIKAIKAVRSAKIRAAWVKWYAERYPEHAEAIAQEVGVDIAQAETEEENVLILQAPETPKKPEITAEDVKWVVDTYNRICESLPKVQKLTDKRRRQIRSLIKKLREDHEDWKAVWEEAMLKTEASSFLRGERTKWRASFDWLLKYDNLVKVLEGKYDDNRRPKRPTRADYENDPYADIYIYGDEPVEDGLAEATEWLEDEKEG